MRAGLRIQVLQLETRRLEGRIGSRPLTWYSSDDGPYWHTGEEMAGRAGIWYRRSLLMGGMDRPWQHISAAT